MNSTVFVTSPTGKVGSELVAALVKKHARVKVGMRDPSKAAGFGWGKVEVVPFDFEDLSGLDQVLAGVDALYLNTPMLHPRELDMAQAMIEGAARAGVRRVVKQSAMGVENQPEGIHFRMEQLLASSGLEYAMIRPNFFMQNFSTMYAEGIKGARAIFLPAGEGRTSFVDTRDLAEVTAAALLGETEPNQVFEITGSEALSHREVAGLIGNELGVEVGFIDISDQDFRAALTGMGLPAQGVEMMSGLYQAVKAGYTGRVTDTVSKVTGHKPISFKEFARDHLSAWK